MELTPRKKAIICSLVKTYISTGEPVGSKTESLIKDIGVSSATLRNEMSDLCEMGYLIQPHTSAGRVPTNAAYRVYVESLQKDLLITDSTKRLINKLLDNSLSDPENLPENAGEILSDLTGLPTIVSSVTSDCCYIRRVEMAPMSRHSLLMFIITSDGMARSRMCRTSTDLTADKLIRADHLISSEVIGKSLDLFNNAFLKRLISMSGDYGVDFLPILSTLFGLVKDITESRVRVGGKHIISERFDNLPAARTAIDYLSGSDAILEVLSEMSEPLEVVYGDRTGISELNPVNLIVARYNTSEDGCGYIGVVGPKRMDYEKVLPSINYFASRFASVMIQAIKDINDWEG